MNALEYSNFIKKNAKFVWKYVLGFKAFQLYVLALLKKTKNDYGVIIKLIKLNHILMPVTD